MALTAKQEAFAQAVITGMSQSDAYRAAYKVRPGTKLESINVAASKLMSDAKVTQRVAELRKPVVEAAQITLASHLARLQCLSEAAEAGNQYSAAIAAEVSRGKASGLYVEKLEHTGKDGGAIATKMTVEYILPPAR